MNSGVSGMELLYLANIAATQYWGYTSTKNYLGLLFLSGNSTLELTGKGSGKTRSRRAEVYSTARFYRGWGQQHHFYVMYFE